MFKKLLAVITILCMGVMLVPAGLSAADPPAGAIAVITGPTHTTPIYLTDPDNFHNHISQATTRDTVRLLADIKTKGQLTVPYGVTIDGLKPDGGRYKLEADANGSWADYNHVVLFGSNSKYAALKNVIVKNTITSPKVRGIQAWQIEGVILDNVQAESGVHDLKVGGSTVTIINCNFNKGSTDLDSGTCTHPTFGSKASVIILYGTKNKSRIHSDGTAGYYCLDARNYVAIGDLIQPNQTTTFPGVTNNPEASIFEQDNRYHGIYTITNNRALSSVTFDGKNKPVKPKREFITYFSVDENGYLLDTAGSPTVTQDSKIYPVRNPVKEQYVGESHEQSMEATIAGSQGFTREGYILEGWNTKPDGSGTDYAIGETIYGNHDKNTGDTWDDDLILYAKWKNATKYTVTWKNYDGTELKTEDFYQGDTPVYTGDTPERTDSTPTPGYHWKFIGWDPEPAPIYQNTTYIAQFEESPPEYTITWKNDDGSLIDTTTVVQDELPTHAAPTKPEDENYTYTFEKWVPDIVPATCDTTYTAQFTKAPKPPVPPGKEVWKRVDTPVAGKTYLIVAGNNWKAVKNNGGNVAAEAVERFNDSDEYVTIAENCTGAQWTAATGWNFKNGSNYLAINVTGTFNKTAALGTKTSVFDWNYASNDLDATVGVGFFGGTDTKYYLTYNGSNFAITENTGNNIRFYERAYYAQYLDGEERVATEYYTAGESFAVHAAPAKEGYTFKDWLCNKDSQPYQPDASYTMPAEDVIFTAQWTAVNYTITYNLNDGETPFGGTNDNPATYTVENAVTLNDPVWSGHNFLGWEVTTSPTTGNATGGKYPNAGITAGSTGNVVFTANWETAVQSHNVTFDLGAHPEENEPAPSQAPLYAGEVFYFPAAPKADNTWTFTGWKNNADDDVYQPGDEFVMPDNDVSFTAQWAQFTVTFKVVNGTWNDGETNEITVNVTNGTLDPAQIPTGLKPAEGYQPNAGGWDKTINTAVGGVTENITYTYTFVLLT